MPAEAAIVSYVLSSVASVGRILESVISLSKEGKRLSEAEFDTLVATEPAANQKSLTGASQQNSAIYSAMTKEVADEIEKNMSNIKDKMRKIATDPTIDPGQRVKEMLLSQKDYCAHLKMIKMFNHDKLPPQLEGEWEKNGCEKFSL